VALFARGNDKGQVGAPGLRFERPLVLSRTQYVDLQHVSRLDIAVVVGALVAFMFGLYLVRVRGRSAIFRSPKLGSSRVWAVGRRP
jgi:hypothetical protein